MFFYIGKESPITSLTQVQENLFLDQGWNESNGIWYKGYSTECRLKDSLTDIIDGYQPAGKWCVIFDNQIYYPKLRGFPVYANGDQKTNLKLVGYEPEFYKVVQMPKMEPALSLDEASILIGDILVENTKNLYKYNDVSDMTSLFSAGLDTLTAWVVLDQVTQNYNFSLYTPTIDDLVDLRSFNGTRRNYSSDLLDKVDDDYWGYFHANFYEELNWNITGYYAEVYTYRDGVAINAIANHHGKRIDELADETDYLYWFLKRPNIVEQYKDSKMKFENDHELKKFLWETIWYDHQMWHLDNNINFSPFADLRIPAVMNRMSVKDITYNSISGQLQRNIINRFRPDLMCLLSDYKNSQDIWKNFRENFTETMINPDTKIIYR
jgi:hypothetical protein